MPMNWINFAYLPVQPYQPLDITKSISQGMQMGAQPVNIYQDTKKQALANYINAVGAQYAAPTALSKLHESQAATQMNLARAQQAAMASALDPMKAQAYINQANAAANLSGTRAQWVGPQAEANMAKLGSQIDLEKAQTNLANYKTNGQANISRRNLTPSARLNEEIDNVNQGMSEDGSYKLNPQQQVEHLNNLYMAMLKNAPSTVRNAIPSINNMDISLNSLDPDVLTQYSGPQGAILKAADAASPKGTQGYDRWTKYNQQLNLSKFIVKQYRKYAQDSVQPTNQEAINSLINPSSLALSPEQASNVTKAAMNTLRTEGRNFRDGAMQYASYVTEPNVDIYGNKVGAQNTIPTNMQSQPSFQQSFNSVAEAKAYLNQLPPAQQSAFKALIQSGKVKVNNG